MKPHINVGIIGHSGHSASLAMSLVRLSSGAKIVDVSLPAPPLAPPPLSQAEIDSIVKTAREGR